MLIKYRVVTARPSPWSVTSVGIGIIAEDPSTQQIRSRFLNGHAYRRLEVLGIQPYVHSIAQELSQALNKTQPLAAQLGFSEPELSAPGYLAVIEKHWNGTVRISPPSVMDADSVDACLGILFEDLIGLSSKPRKQSPREQLRGKVSRAYQGIPAVLTKRPRLNIAGIDRSFDFAVQSEYGVEEISQTQVFGTDEDLVQTADALTQRIQELRTNGATYIHNGEHHTIGNDVEIAVFFTIPHADRNEAMELADSYSTRWADERTRVIPALAIPEHAHRLAERIGA